MDKVRLGIIGCGGGIAKYHLNYLSKIEHLEVTAGSEIQPEALAKFVEATGAKGFADGHELIRSGLVDAILIATPHYFHPEFAKSAFDAGVHVLTEKPVAVTAKEAIAVNDAYEAALKKHPGLLYAAMFNLRAEPTYRAIKDLIESGRVGELIRVSWNITTWYRTQAYYNSGSWRATWKGEGGGVLLNQCPHNLDLLWWFAGMPSQIQAVAHLGKYHAIEVEDAVSALLTYPNGATGTFTTSTVEAPGVNRLEIVGDRGTVIFDSFQITFHETGSSIFEQVRTSPNLPLFTKYEITPGKPADFHGHRATTENFVAAIRQGAPLLAPGVEGVHSLQLSNAMLLAGLTGQPVQTPNDGQAFATKLDELIAASPKK